MIAVVQFLIAIAMFLGYRTAGLWRDFLIPDCDQSTRSNEPRSSLPWHGFGGKIEALLPYGPGGRGYPSFQAAPGHSRGTAGTWLPRRTRQDATERQFEFRRASAGREDTRGHATDYWQGIRQG